MPDAEKVAELVERVEVIINRHSPMNNFEIKELCAREIVQFFRQRDRETEAKVWGEAADRHREYCTAITVNCCSQCKDFRRKAQEVSHDKS